jgi:NAD(P)-dependent dehydrogenase (short-subunit alcohol dehydrogenase family)
MAFPTDRPAVWFVTGTSRGLGLELVRQLLRRGDRVAATTRSPERLLSALGDTTATASTDPTTTTGTTATGTTGPVDTTRLLPLTVDLRDERQVERAVTRTTEHFGGLDVVVNNAGYGYLGAVEETSDRDVRDMLDVQVVGVWNVLRSTIPVLREQRGGHIVNVSSVLGLTSVPGWALYCAGKFALEGISEALAGEVADFGIDVTLVEPGYFRTDFLTRDSLALPRATTGHYPALREMVENHLALQGSQLGDPVAGAAAVIDRVVTGEGPLRQLLGSDAHSYATAKVQALRANLDATAGTAPATDFPDAA